MTGLVLDGAPLMNKAFSANNPVIYLGLTQTQTGKDEHEGYRFLFVCAVQAIRNPGAHEPLSDQLDEAVAFEQLNLASLLMRRLDVIAAGGVASV
jgi:uncharacterized protein (TIGR02391 family)